MDVFPDCADLEVHARAARCGGARTRSPARNFDSLFVRHWDTWSDGTRSNLFVAPVNADGRAGAPVNVSRALDADVPSKPFGGAEEFTFSPDGTRMVFSARVAGREEAWSTNFDLYEAPSDGSAAPRNLTADNPAWDTQPVFLRNGDLAWLAMSRPGFEADRFRIKVMRGGAVREVAPDWDRSVQHLERGARRPHAARDGERPRTDAAVLRGRRQRPRDADLRARATSANSRPPKRGAVVLWHDLASPPDLYLLTGKRRAAPAHDRATRTSSRRARSAPSSSSVSRAGTTRPCTATS